VRLLPTAHAQSLSRSCPVSYLFNMDDADLSQPFVEYIQLLFNLHQDRKEHVSGLTRCTALLLCGDRNSANARKL